MKKNELREFQDWMEKTRFISEASSAVYASRVRTLLKKTDGKPTTVKLDQLLRQSWSAASRDSYYSAWNRFVEFGKSKSILIAAPTERWVTRRKRKKYNVPPEIADRILDVIDISGVKATVIPFLKWKDVHHPPMNGMWEVWDSRFPGTYYTLPVHQTAQVFDWSAGGRPTPDTPLVAIKTGSTEPMPIAPLRRVLAARRRSR